MAPPCIFFQRGQCRNGSACTFSHETQHRERERDSRDRVCSYYLMGNCRFGSSCAMAHPISPGSASEGPGRVGRDREEHPSNSIANTNANAADVASTSKSDWVSGDTVASRDRLLSGSSSLPPASATFPDYFDDFDPTLPPSHSDFLLSNAPYSLPKHVNQNHPNNVNLDFGHSLWQQDFDKEDVLAPPSMEMPLVIPTNSSANAYLPDLNDLDHFPDALNIHSDGFPSDSSNNEESMSPNQLSPQQPAYTPYSVIAKANAAAVAATATAANGVSSPKKFGNATNMSLNGNGCLPGTPPKNLLIRSEMPVSSVSSDGRAHSSDDDALCPFAYNGLCRFGIKCRYTHGLKCPRCQKFCLHPRNLELRDKHMEECANSDLRAFEAGESMGLSGSLGGVGGSLGGGGGYFFPPVGIPASSAVAGAATAAGFGMSAAKMSSEMDCVVCFDRVLRKPDPRFGLLICDHCVCLECARQWRRNESMDNAKACPICRQISHIIIPSSIWITDPYEKEVALDAYKKRMNKIDCKHYNFGEGTCPFGTSCLYRHVRRDGSADEGRVRFVVGGQEGEARVIGAVQLFDFF
ncbi:hypothetical protein BJ741DRAFT_609284 [Chytriomyces cf. hyalinus JEL632]|nr:hypothetical protein BJ741DRAFT_609284 [Chytriomyces cf. hyalinus JEL632]